MENYHLQEVKKTINGPMSIAMLICWRVPMVGKPFVNLKNPEEIDFRENRHRNTSYFWLFGVLAICFLEDP